MQLCKVQLKTGEVRAGSIQDNRIWLLDFPRDNGLDSLTNILHSPDPVALVFDLIEQNDSQFALEDLTLLAPIDQQEVWAAGVTYKRSQEARERESEGAGRFYDLVYTAPRPELFFKTTSHRVVGPGGHVRIRRDSRWSVPEPELALVLSPQLKLVGFTIGNDMSARDIEGENPLYLPQAKIYDHCCALGPVITLADFMPAADQVAIRLSIERLEKKIFVGSTSLTSMARTFADLIGWLGRDNSFPNGVILLTGTGIVPPDEFALAPDDLITIEMSGIGSLINRVEQFDHV